MSLKSILSGTSAIDKEFQSIIRRNLPGKAQFRATHNVAPFSSYDPLVPYSLHTPSDAGLVGTAFDYLARAMIARQLAKIPNAAWMDLKAQQALARIKARKQLSDDSLYDLKQRYVNSLSNYLNYILSGIGQLSSRFDDMAQIEFDAASIYYRNAAFSSFQPITQITLLIPDAVYFARLEQVYRNGGKVFSPEASDLYETPSAEVHHELTLLCEVFQQRFIDEKLVTAESTVVFNPSFGILSKLCDGADADIFIDGILFDFKSGKETGYAWQEVAQLVAYYCLHLGACKLKKDKLPIPLRGHEIATIALYRARYGIVEYCPTSCIDKTVAIDLCNHLANRLQTMT